MDPNQATSTETHLPPQVSTLQTPPTSDPSSALLLTAPLEHTLSVVPPAQTTFDPLFEPPPLLPRAPDPPYEDPSPPKTARTRSTTARQGTSVVTDVETPSSFPTKPVHWNKAVPPSTEEPTISISDLRQIHFVRTGTYISEEEIPSSLLSTEVLQSRRSFLDDDPPSASPPTSDLPIHQTAVDNDPEDFAISAISSDQLTDEEIALGPKLSRRALLKLETWPRWQAAEWKQLDQFHTLEMFGKPCRPQPDATIMRFHWAYKQKEDGTYRSRFCGDGSRRALPQLYDLLDTYHSCLASPIYRMHLALCAVNGLIDYGADVVDAYAHSEAPNLPCYLYVDAAYRDWWYNKTGETLAPGLVLPLNGALQGHPEAGKSYEKKKGSSFLQSDQRCQKGSAGGREKRIPTSAYFLPIHFYSECTKLVY
jgi:hypothetical protein